MTSRERLLCVLNGGIPDKVPVSPFIQEEYLLIISIRKIQTGFLTRWPFEKNLILIW